MNSTVSGLEFVIAICFSYLIVNIVIHYIYSRRKGCEVCSGRNIVSDCCSDYVKYVPNPSNVEKNMQKCGSCGKYCKSVNCKCSG